MKNQKRLIFVLVPLFNVSHSFKAFKTVSKVTNKMFSTEVPLESIPKTLVKYICLGLGNVNTFKQSHTKQKIPARKDSN